MDSEIARTILADHDIQRLRVINLESQLAATKEELCSVKEELRSLKEQALGLAKENNALRVQQAQQVAYTPEKIAVIEKRMASISNAVDLVPRVAQLLVREQLDPSSGPINLADFDTLDLLVAAVHHALQDRGV
ncbi:hypothetical protein NMY22_g13583 [Coprinellus aureogranulatus]|nr:hypothetical protein NMY22_g13583 [Coprinellus aureogranulatus]